MEKGIDENKNRCVNNRLADAELDDVAGGGILLCEGGDGNAVSLDYYSFASSGDNPLYQVGEQRMYGNNTVRVIEVKDKQGSFFKEFVYAIVITNSSYGPNIGQSGDVFEHQLER